MAKTHAARTSAFRPDIEGLRAFAVVLVVLDHVFRAPAGGFIGVDVFYVLSGFLITGILLREHATTGWISFTRFYARRIKRILPAAVLVLLVTVVAAYALWFRPRADQTLIDAVAAIGFVANWHFIRTGTDYLQADGPLSPVQHFWSLSVEEQFYIAWPWLIILVIGLVARRARSRGAGGARGGRSSRDGDRSLWLAAAVGAVIALSFGYACYLSATDAPAAYFDTFTRGWELAVGALLAVLAAHTAKIPAVIGSVLSWAGVALLVAGAFLLTPESSFPGPWAAVPVVAAALVIAGGANPASGRTAVLVNPVAGYVGRISYSLYLWHFPVIVFTVSAVPSPTWSTHLFMLATMALLSCLSYHFVENPIRTSSWLTGEQARRRPGHAGHRRLEVAVGILVAVALVGLSVVQLKGPAAVADASQARDVVSPSSVQLRTLTDAPFASESEVSGAIDRAVTAGSWPSLTPSLDELGAEQAAPQMDQESGCRNTVGARDPLVCESGQGTRTALVIGDSVALSWMPAVEAALGGDWTVHGIGYASCPAVDVRIGDSRFAEGCRAAQDRMIATSAELNPQLIITSSAQSSLDRMSATRGGDGVAASWQEGMASTLAELTALAPHVVVLGNPPAGPDPLACATRATGPGNCVSDIQPAWFEKRSAEQAAVAEAAASGASVRYVDVRPWTCDDDGRCPLFIGGTVVRFDAGHLTNVFGQRVAPLLATELAEALAGNGGA